MKKGYRFFVIDMGFLSGREICCLARSLFN